MEKAILTPGNGFSRKEEAIKFVLEFPLKLPIGRWGDTLWPLGAVLGEEPSRLPYYDLAIEIAKSFFPNHHDGKKFGVIPGSYTRSKKGNITFTAESLETATTVLFYTDNMIDWYCGTHNLDSIHTYNLGKYGAYMTILPISTVADLANC